LPTKLAFAIHNENVMLIKQMIHAHDDPKAGAEKQVDFLY
jgi:hypothetical protein